MQDGADPGDIPGDVTWLSYAELGQLRGISAASAKRLSNRRRWRKRAGNDGTTRVAVPAAEAVPRETVPGDVSGDIPCIVSAFEAAIASLTERASIAESRADRAEHALADERARADDLRARLDAAEALAEQVEARGDRALAELERTRAAGMEALQTAEALRQAETERRARSLLARLKAAWRGE